MPMSGVVFLPSSPQPESQAVADISQQIHEAVKNNFFCVIMIEIMSTVDI